MKQPTIPIHSGRTKASRTRPEFNQLELFLKVVETRSFAAAGRQTGRTQPAVAQTISRLEDICGGDLFERQRGMPLALTPMLELVAMGLGATVSFESAIVPSAGVVFRPIHDRKAMVPIIGAWHDGDRNPLRHRLLGLVRMHANRKRGSR